MAQLQPRFGTIDYMNRKQLRRIARDLNINHSNDTSNAALITAIKAA